VTRATRQVAVPYGAMAGRGGAVLGWIVAFKALKSSVLLIVGVTLLVDRQADPAEFLMRMALRFHMPMSSQLLQRALALAALTVAHQTALGLTACAYGCLLGAEGIGLFLRAAWARWLTIVATSALIPLEVFEVLRRPHTTRVLLLVANVAIVAYLVRRREIFERA
jgi:uncharacterized membrane protein (DUF2068 family)